MANKGKVSYSDSFYAIMGVCKRKFGVERAGMRWWHLP